MRVLAALVALGLATPVAAQEMQPLRDEIAGGAPLSYIATRCSAFFAASAAHLGEQVDPDMQSQVEMIVGLLMSTGVNAMQADGMTHDAAVDAASREVAELTAAYHTRFAANQAADHPAFAEDPLYMADNEDCVSVLAPPPAE
ncbi:hypothetical protein [Nioella nitratireducens]|uniref:hypothetical protein n=1 Tax=Nioella nitratireducens TaxID=1287720 RepID=UPI0008FCFE32|nr:hypothetical protein [Nioella nitratireducens]